MQCIIHTETQGRHQTGIRLETKVNASRDSGMNTWEMGLGNGTAVCLSQVYTKNSKIEKGNLNLLSKKLLQRIRKNVNCVSEMLNVRLIASVIQVRCQG